jgi:hypothetical protein
MIAKYFNHPENIFVRKGVSLSEVRAPVFADEVPLRSKSKHLNTFLVNIALKNIYK